MGYEIVAPSEERQALFRSGVEVRQLDEVVEALCDAARGHRWFCVERRGQRYRWSFATTGGPYPLLRLACRFLGIPHYWVLSSIPPSRLVHPGGGGRGTSRHLAVIDLDPYVPTTMVRARTLGALN